jgi:hypothetical protein
MDTELTQPVQETRALTDRLTPAQIKADTDLILQVMHATMTKGQDYGVIPGTDKPTLYKPGAEKLMMTFRLAGEPTIADLSAGDVIRYRVMTRMIHAPSGMTLGYGVGEASTDEEKYKWRKPVCDAEFDETPEDRRRVAWKKKKDQTPYSQKQIRTVPADLANTVLKMADKRSLIGGVLKVTAASALFAQDLEELSAEMREAVASAPEGSMPDPIPDPRPASVSQSPSTIDPGARGGAQEGPKPVPPTFRPMKSKMSGSCASCDARIHEGDAIFYDPDAKRAHHQKHFA